MANAVGYTEERMIERNVEDAKHYLHETKEKFDHLVADHPLLFVAGAFIGGILIGKMLTEKG